MYEPPWPLHPFSEFSSVEMTHPRFLVTPYSLFVSLALAVALAPPIYLSHYTAFSSLQVPL